MILLPAFYLCPEYIINNETIDTFDGHLTYQWLINNQPVSNERDLRYTFESTGSQEIKLITSIPGCSDEATQTIPQVYEGPAVDFSFTGACDGDEYNFMNLTTGEVATYIWDFGDESSSSAVNPRHTFGSVGNYAVTLTAINDVGCKNTATKTVSVYAAPKADFSILPPPFACSGSETPFTNLTTSPQGTIASYQWQFGDGEGSSTAVNPRYTYTQAGSYQVSLRAESAEGCSDTLEKTITIAPSPSPDFTFTTPCLNTPVTFTNTTSETLKSFYWTIDGSNMFVPSPTRTFRSTGTITATLHATGNNNCLASASKMLTIPVPLQPDFSVTTNCAGHATVFTNETSDGHDPVQSMAWNFSGQGTASISPATFTYSTAGVKQVALTVTAVSGCTYSATKSVNIVSAPKANFTPSLTTGVPPLEVTFTNASTHATHYTWTIPDQPSRITTDVNPVHVFENLGEFHVELKATNAYGCEDVVSKVITAVAPLPDVEVNRVSVTENADGSYRIIVTLKNKGNTVIRNLPLKLDLANHVSLNDQVAGPIQPATLFNYLIPFTVSRSNPLSFVCAIADLPGDLDEENNRVCVQLDDAIFFYPVHPNPVHAFINLEWIARKDWPVSVALVDNTGKKLIDQTLSSAEGFNRRVLDVQGVKEGLYLLLLKHGSARFTQRIFVGGKN
jgi:PKD repeat protein